MNYYCMTCKQQGMYCTLQCTCVLYIDFYNLSLSLFMKLTYSLFCLSLNSLSSVPIHFRVPNFNNPFCFDIHYSPVTSLVYCGNCPDDFIAQLHSVKSKLPHTPASTKVQYTTVY